MLVCCRSSYLDVCAFPSRFDFVFATDNPCFTVASAGANIAAKKPQSIVVKFAAVEGKPKLGKLLVSCPAKKSLPPWVYYLQGE